MHPRQVSCWITHTNERTHEIIRGGLDRSPMFTGVIEGVGPRYCPSIEDKIHRFAGKASHQIFLEPEGLDDPRDLSERNLDQPALRRPAGRSCIRSRAWSARTCCAPATPSSTTTSIRGDSSPRSRPRPSPDSSSPGQINGTTGYEEAAAQGLLAGLNAALQRARRDRLVPAPRRGLPGRPGGRPGHARRLRALPHVHEPRRVPPAAARGQRRPAPHRGGPQARAWSTMRAGPPSAASATRSNRETAQLRKTWVRPADISLKDQMDTVGQPLEREYSLFDLLRRPGVSYQAL